MGLGVHSIALSAGGQRLAYVAYAARGNVWSVPIPSTGTVDVSSATAVTAGNQIVEGLQVSRDGRWLVYDSTLYGNSQIFRVPIAGGPVERLMIDAADNFNADLSPDGSTVVYHSFRLGNRDVFVQGTDGGQAQPVTSSGPEGQESYPLWAPDRETILFRDQLRGNMQFIFRRTPSGAWGEPVAVQGASGSGSWLPDGRSLVYASRGALNVVATDGGSPRLLYAPASGSTDPRVERAVVSDDGARSISRATTRAGWRRSGQSRSGAADPDSSSGSAQRRRRFAATSRRAPAGCTSLSKIGRQISSSPT